MHHSKVSLQVASGDLPETAYDFDEPVQCIIGRADDSDIRVPNDFYHGDVSRHHCLVEIDPPVVRVRDLGSRNGTYVNGRKIGQRLGYQEAEDTDVREFADIPLQDGDELQVGHTVFRVQIEAAETAQAGYAAAHAAR